MDTDAYEYIGPSEDRIRDLMNRMGIDWAHASRVAWLEYQVSDQWPTGWGGDLQIYVYGDFDPPNRPLHFPELGIIVHEEKQATTGITMARCVLKASVRVSERSVAGVLDATRRINCMLGAWSLVTWGTCACGWWSPIISTNILTTIQKLDKEEFPDAITGIEGLQSDVRQRVDAALYWIREPRNLSIEHHRNSVLRVFAGYWNAFECLVDAVLILRPMQKLSRSQKQSRIDDFIAKRDGRLTGADIAECYQQIVNPGLVGRARHALLQCFPVEGEQYAFECFHRPDRNNRLYDIRNAINHGDIDAENPEEHLRVESRLHKLWVIVWRMFGQLVPFNAPIEEPTPNKIFKETG